MVASGMEVADIAVMFCLPELFERSKNVVTCVQCVQEDCIDSATGKRTELPINQAVCDMCGTAQKADTYTPATGGSPLQAAAPEVAAANLDPLTALGEQTQAATTEASGASLDDLLQEAAATARSESQARGGRRDGHDNRPQRRGEQPRANRYEHTSSSVSSSSPSEQPTMRRCGNCRAQYPIGAGRCGNCRAPLPQ